MAAAQRQSSRETTHAHAHAGPKQEDGARGNGHAGYTIDFLTGKIGLGSHVLVALNRCLTPSQVGRVVAAFRAGASLARGLEVRGREPAELVRDPRFGWLAAVKPAAEIAAPAHEATALVDKLTAAVVSEVTSGGRSAKVLLEVVEVARRNHVAPALCDRLRETPHPQHGNCFNALLALTGSEGSAALEHLVEGTLGHEGVDVAPDAAVGKLGPHDKLWRAAKYGGIDTLGETAKQLLELLPGLAVFWAASHVTVLGPALDVLGLGMLGAASVTGVQELLTFRTMAEEARTEADLKVAGAHFAKGIVTLGLTGVFVLLGWRQRRAQDASGMEARGQASNAVPIEHGVAKSVPAADASKDAAPVAKHEHAPLAKADEHARSQPTTDLSNGTKPEPQTAHGPTEDHTSTEKRVDEKVEGHAESVHGLPPKGWTIVHETVRFDPISGRPYASTEVVDPNGGISRFVRSYNPAKKMLSFDYAFLHKDAPRWVRHEGTMMKGKGTPTQSYWTMRQLKGLLRLGGTADVKSVKMSTVQNVKTILQLETAKRAGVDPSTVLADTASVRYASTPLTQMDMHPVPGSVKISDGERGPIGALMQLQEMRDFADRAENDALLLKFGFTRADVVEHSFDITFDVSATPHGARK